MKVNSDLCDLLQQWFWARPVGPPWNFVPQPVTTVPASLVATITHHEPYHSQVLQDALLWLQLPLLVGIGLEAIPVEPLAIRAIEQWEEAISPVPVYLSWSRTMAGDEVDWSSNSVHWVAKEAGQWRIVCLFSDEDREVAQQLIHGEEKC